MNDRLPLLAVDTLSTRCSVALWRGGDAMYHQQGSGRRRHAREVLGLVDAVLKDAGSAMTALQALAVIRGPGSFTGLRIGNSVVQGLGFAAGIPVLPVSSLALLAMAASIRKGGSDDACACLLRARPGEYYHARYEFEDGIPQLSGEECVVSLQQVAGPEDACSLVCDQDTADAMKVDGLYHCHQQVLVVQSDAVVLAQLADRVISREPGSLVAPEAVVPTYIKNDLEYRKSGIAPA